MIRISRWLASAAVVTFAAVNAGPALAQYESQYYAPKLLHQGKTSKAISGTGTVIVQVQVNPNGSHKAIRVLKSTNAGDNAAALDIAQNSTYKPARRGSRSVPAFYDFTLKFTGKTVAAAKEAPPQFSGKAAQIDHLIRSGNYAAAKAQAQQALASRPDDAILNSELGAANYFLNDYAAAATSFSKVGALNAEFKPVATISFIAAAKSMLQTNPTQAVAYAQKAVALMPNGNSYFMLGAAEAAAGSSTQAIADLKHARDLVFADQKTTAKERVNVDGQLYSAYVKAGDTADAQATLAEMKRLDPSNPAIGTYVANSYIVQGQSLEKQGKYEEAIEAYQQGAQGGTPEAQVTGYTSAALAMGNMLEKQKTTPTAADYQKMKALADKALAVKPDDAMANYAEGIALANEYAVGGKSNAQLKAQALAALDKAKAAAQAAGNVSLSLSIDNFKKTIP
jgi:TonB family protein